jgi:hypothetical protein
MGRGSSLRVFLWGGALALALGGSYLAWTFYGRRQADLQFEKRVEQKELEAGRRFRAAYGSDDVKISGFVVRPPVIRRGQETLFCYGVLNAKVVRLEPPIDSVHPALSYCFNASPTKTTRFTLTAEDGQGRSVQKTVTVTVK